MHKGELRCYHHVIYQVCLACTASAYMTWTFRKLEMAIVRAVSFLHVGEARSCDLCCTLAVWGKVVLLPLVLYLFCARGKLILLMHLFMCVRNLVQLVSSCEGGLYSYCLNCICSVCEGSLYLCYPCCKCCPGTCWYYVSSFIHTYCSPTVKLGFILWWYGR